MSSTDLHAFDLLSGLVVLLDAAGKVIHWNRACSEQTGKSAEMAREKHLWDLVMHPEDVEQAKAAFANLLEQGRSNTKETWVTTTGERITVHCSGATMLGHTGHVERVIITGVAGPVRDDGRRGQKQAEKPGESEGSLRTVLEAVPNERLLESIFEILPVGIWIADETGRIVRTNPAGLRIWGGARYVGVSEFHEYRGWWADTGKPIAAEEWALARALTRGETSLGELIRIQTFDGAFKTVINSALPLYDGNGKFAGAIVVNEDVTSLKETEEALRRAVQARDALLSIVAHDLRTPLNVILMQLALLRRRGQEPERRNQKAIDAILRQARRIDNLIHDLLDVASIDSGVFTIERAPISVGRVLEEALETQRQAAQEAEIDLRADGGSLSAPISADHDRILQVLDNLIGNAIKFTKAGGRITVTASRNAGEVLFRVVDTGVGIRADDIPHLFDRFWQARRSDKRGAGLGLAIAKAIVQSHGGRIWVESQLGIGTKVHFTIPVCSEDAE